MEQKNLLLYPALEALADRTPGWLQPNGPESDVVVASRIRLARNIGGQSFPQLLKPEQAREICVIARDRVGEFFEDGLVIEPAALKEADRHFLIERSLASRDLLDAQRPTLVFFNAVETIGLMVNEEDHFRLQTLAPGFQLSEAYKACLPLSRQLGQAFTLATHDRFGFLTACPTNVGTGLRASLLVQIPALVRAKQQFQHVLKTAQRSNLAVRGVHGEGSRALGNLYQISNQRTLGNSAQDQIAAVAEFGELIVKYEHDVRTALFDESENRSNFENSVVLAYRQLQSAKKLTTAQALESLSTLRLAAFGEVRVQPEMELDPVELIRQVFRVQPGHLQARIGAELGPEARDYSRAKILREALKIPFRPDEGYA